MQKIELLLAIFGGGWIFVILIISILGGRVLIQIKNPLTKEIDNITDVTFNSKRDNKYK
ncbi:hypothetical protein KGR20_24085 [Cytobacillus oceanisediminis]|uniref:hypothetical protein n=1 Tax=Cytobacillus oceanisediminis TaxID=665099 RepID=UPI001CCE3DE4|nr:hypothetical protein [Cytobacillus oceanisediminis]MBZ9537223.1 hypothetical protein [Cytobacillus oceanisediminis]